jgi:hypothetical protein
MKKKGGMPNINIVCSVWHILTDPFCYMEMSVCDELADCDGVLFQELDSSYQPFFLHTAAAPNLIALTSK